MESTRRFKPPWSVMRENSECYTVRDANGVTVAWLFCRDDSQRYSVGASKLTSEEARRIGKAISRIPECMLPRQGFYPRGGGPRWRADRPYHVALEKPVSKSTKPRNFDSQDAIRSRAKIPQAHDPANIVETRQCVVPRNRAGFEFWQLERNLLGKIAKFVSCHVRQFGNRPEKHRFLHRLTAPIAAF